MWCKFAVSWVSLIFCSDSAEISIVVKAPSIAWRSRHFPQCTDASHNTYMQTCQNKTKQQMKKKHVCPWNTCLSKAKFSASMCMKWKFSQTLNSCSEVCKLSCPIKDGEQREAVIMNNRYDNLLKWSTFVQFYLWSSLWSNAAAVQI